MWAAKNLGFSIRVSVVRELTLFKREPIQTRGARLCLSHYKKLFTSFHIRKQRVVSLTNKKKSNEQFFKLTKYIFNTHDHENVKNLKF